MEIVTATILEAFEENRCIYLLSQAGFGSSLYVSIGSCVGNRNRIWLKMAFAHIVFASCSFDNCTATFCIWPSSSSPCNPTANLHVPLADCDLQPVLHNDQTLAHTLL